MELYSLKIDKKQESISLLTFVLSMQDYFLIAARIEEELHHAFRHCDLCMGAN